MRYLKYLFLIIIAGLLFEAGRFAYGMLKIGAGYNAKIMCSCVFVSNRTAQSVQEQELANGVSSFIPAQVDLEDQSATANFMGIERKAIFRPGYGCTLISEITESELRGQRLPAIRPFEAPIHTLIWPYGNLDTLSMPTNINQSQLQSAFDYAFDEPEPDNPRYSRAALVVYKGKIIKEQYGAGIDENTPLLGWSMTKSVTNSLVGILTKDGKIDVNEYADVPEWHQDPDDPRSLIKLNDLMHMTSGLDFEEDYASVSQVNKMLWLKSSTGATATASELAHPTDTEWYYSSGTTNIISDIIRRKINDDDAYHQFPSERLFKPLGMSSAVMEMDASGTFVGSSFMYATARDWAKFGMLYLNEGVWNGEQILPKGWTTYSSTRTPVLKDWGFYSAQFWNNAYSEPPGTTMPRHWPEVPMDAYYASGFEGQQVVIVPSMDLVIVRLGFTADRANWDAGKFVSAVVKAVP